MENLTVLECFSSHTSIKEIYNFPMEPTKENTNLLLVLMDSIFIKNLSLVKH